MMFQNYALFPHLSCLDNVGFALKMKGIKKVERKAKSLELLKLVQMDDFADSFPTNFLVGNKSSFGKGSYNKSFYFAS